MSIEGKLVELTSTEFMIFYQLAGKPGWVFTRQQTIDLILSYDYLIIPRAIDVQFFGLLNKLGSAGHP